MSNAGGVAKQKEINDAPLIMSAQTEISVYAMSEIYSPHAHSFDGLFKEVI